jgi:hypothetical protein
VTASWVAADAVGEGAQFGQVAGLGPSEPALQFLLALAPGHDLGEAAHVGGQDAQVGTAVLETGELGLFLIAESGGAGQQPAG